MLKFKKSGKSSALSSGCIKKTEQRFLDFSGHCYFYSAKLNIYSDRFSSFQGAVGFFKGINESQIYCFYRLKKMATCVHSTLIQKFCRVCGNTMKGRVTYIAEKYTEALKNTFMGTFDIENNDIYPRSFCNTCYTTVLNKRKNNFESKNPAFIWSAHNPVICTHMLTKSKGGRPKKRQNKGGETSHNQQSHHNRGHT